MHIAKLNNLQKSLPNPNNLTRQANSITMAATIPRNPITQTPRVNPLIPPTPIPTPTLLPLPMQNESISVSIENLFRKKKRNVVAITISAIIADHSNISSMLVLINPKLQSIYNLDHRLLILAILLPNIRTPNSLRENDNLKPL